MIISNTNNNKNIIWVNLQPYKLSQCISYFGTVVHLSYCFIHLYVGAGMGRSSHPFLCIHTCHGQKKESDSCEEKSTQARSSLSVEWEFYGGCHRCCQKQANVTESSLQSLWSAKVHTADETSGKNRAQSKARSPQCTISWTRRKVSWLHT